ncbi:hypothetical protein ACWEV4_06105, partial [Streptomyces sp. NPDC003860]
DAAAAPATSVTTATATAPPVFGLAPEWLLHRGRPLAAATVLSHPEQLARLTAACPEAAPTAAIAGDPCYDRILAALPHRDRFRRALGVGPHQRLVVLNSTWSTRGLLNDALPRLLPRLASELPADEYRTAAVLHPNIWYGHGPGQVRAWLDRARRAGLVTVSPLDAWRQAIVAADCVIGDHGSVTYYAAAVGTPVLLGAFPSDDDHGADSVLDPASPVAALGRTAPALRGPGRAGDLRAQIDRAIDTHAPDRYAGLAALTSSVPGESAALLRRLFYGLLGLPEPGHGPALLDPLPLPAYEPAERTAPVRVFTRILGTDPARVAVVRHSETGPDDPAGDAADDADAAHTAVHEDTRDPGRLRVADVIVRHGPADDPRVGPPAAWTAEVLARHPYCRLAVWVDGPDRCVVRTRSGRLVRLRAQPGADGRTDLTDPAAYASALHGWLVMQGASSLPTWLVVVTGRAHHQVSVEHAPR